MQSSLYVKMSLSERAEEEDDADANGCTICSEALKEGGLKSTGRMMVVRVETNGDWRVIVKEGLIMTPQDMVTVLGGYLNTVGCGENEDCLMAYCDCDAVDKEYKPNYRKDDLHYLFQKEFKGSIPRYLQYIMKSPVGPIVISRTDEYAVQVGLLRRDLMNIAKYFGPCKCMTVLVLLLLLLLLPLLVLVSLLIKTTIILQAVVAEKMKAVAESTAAESEGSESEPLDAGEKKRQRSKVQ